MAFLQGSSYELPIKITDCSGNVVDDSVVKEASFSIGEIVKSFGKEDSDVRFDYEMQSWIVPLSEDDTFKLRESVEWQARFLFSDGKVDGTIPQNEYIYDSINKTRFTGGSDNA